MTKISLIQGTPYSSEKIIEKIRHNKKLNHIRCREVGTVYGVCWIFSFHIKLKFLNRFERFVGWYGGLDELTSSPGVVNEIPKTKLIQVQDINILPDKLSAEMAENITWTYNLRWIKKRYRVLFSSINKIKTDINKYYKPIYIIEFYNEKLNQKLYKYLDSLNGDLSSINYKYSE